MGRIILVLFIALFSAGNGAADEGEIAYLLRFVDNSGCTFIRNGKEYPSEKASDHLEFKYTKVKKHITATEDFIEKIGSKSSLTGKKYRVNCDGNDQDAESWLKAALKSYRQQ